MTFDQLAIRAPTGKNTMLVQGKWYSTHSLDMMRNITLTKEMIFIKL